MGVFAGSPWRLTGFAYEGQPVYRHVQTGELAQEILQEGRLAALPPNINAMLLLAQELTAGVVSAPRPPNWRVKICDDK